MRFKLLNGKHAGPSSSEKKKKSKVYEAPDVVVSDERLDKMFPKRFELLSTSDAPPPGKKAAKKAAKAAAKEALLPPKTGEWSDVTTTFEGVPEGMSIQKKKGGFYRIFRDGVELTAKPIKKAAVLAILEDEG